MPATEVPQGVGLYTDGSGVTAPLGALRTANNVVLYRPGLICPRPGFGDTTGVATLTGFNPVVTGWSYDGDVLLQTRSAANAWKIITVTNADDVGDHAPPSGRGVSSAAELRKNLYVTTSAGVYVSSGAADPMYRAGAWTYYQPASHSLIDLTSASEDADHASVDSDSSVAYRWVWRGSDPNAYERRSAPSSRQIVRVPSSYTTGARVELGTIKVHPEWSAGESLELYRTRNSGSETADPGEDYYLAAEYILTSSDVSNGYTPDDAWDDRVPDDALGPALYTSISQLGARESKEVPPQGKVAASWGRCLWLGDTTERAAQLIQVREVRATPASDGTGLCGDLTGTYSGVSGNDLTGVSLSAAEWDCMAAGMWITDGGAPGTSSGGIPLLTKVTAFDEGAQTITLSQAPSGSGSIKAGDIVTVGTVSIYCYTSESLALQRFKQSTDADPATRCYETSLSLARVIAYNAESCSATAIKDELIGSGDGTFLVLEDDPVDNNLTLTCTSRGGAFVPDITASYDVQDKVRTVRPGGIAWSAIDEPEAWPPLQSSPVGDVERKVLALTPLDNALLVWKDDGLFRVTGTPPQGVAIDEVTASSDCPLRLVSPQCTAVLGGAAYGWTDQGIVEVTEGGIRRVISDAISDVLRSAQLDLPRGNTDSQRGYWMRAHSRRGLIILSLADASDDEYGSEQYVWSRATGAWSRWTRADRCMVYDAAEDRMLACPAANGTATIALYERTDEGAAASYVDAIVAGITPDGIGTSTTFTLSDFGGFSPAACDVLAYLPDEGEDVEYFLVTSVSEPDDGQITFTLSGTPTNGDGSVTWYQGWKSEILWQALRLGGLGQRWQELHIEFEETDSAYLASGSVELGVGGAAHRDAAVSTVSAVFPGAVTYSDTVRVGVPRACVRTQHLYPYASICGAGVRWEMGRIIAHHSITSRRVSR